MSKFDFMGFGYGGGGDEAFAANAKKFTPNETIALCKQEYEHRFGECVPIKRRLREPTVEDVQRLWCAHRFNVSPEWPEGCYTFVKEGTQGSFPVWVVEFCKLEVPT